MEDVWDLSDVDGIRRRIAVLCYALNKIDREFSSVQPKELSELHYKRGMAYLKELMEVANEHNSVTHYDLDI